MITFTIEQIQKSEAIAFANWVLQFNEAYLSKFSTEQLYEMFLKEKIKIIING